MSRSSDDRAAKEFLVAEIVAEAERTRVPLTKIERKMLFFSESGWTLPDMPEIANAFSREYDEHDYERKISQREAVIDRIIDRILSVVAGVKRE